MDRIELDYRPCRLNPNPGPVWELDAGDETTEVHEGKFLVGERRKGYFTPEHIFCDAQSGAPLSSNEVEMILIPWSIDTAAIEEAMVHAVIDRGSLRQDSRDVGDRARPAERAAHHAICLRAGDGLLGCGAACSYGHVDGPADACRRRQEA